jgi:hypothetical protein
LPALFHCERIAFPCDATDSLQADSPKAVNLEESHLHLRFMSVRAISGQGPEQLLMIRDYRFVRLSLIMRSSSSLSSFALLKQTSTSSFY